MIIWKIHILPPDVLKDDYKKYVPQYNGYRYRLSKVRRGLCCPSEDWTLNYFEYIFEHVLFESIQKIYKIFYCLFKESFLLFILNYLEYIWKMINIFYYRLYRFFIISFKKHRMRFIKNMYHNIMDIDIDCPKSGEAFVVLRRNILNLSRLFWIYFITRSFWINSKN